MYNLKSYKLSDREMFMEHPKRSREIETGPGTVEATATRCKQENGTTRR